MIPTTICFINQKGGCGKSSTCYHLAGALAHDGFRALLVDVDPQGSLSQGLLGSEMVEQLPVGQTVASLFDEESFAARTPSLIQATDFERISLCPANHPPTSGEA